MEVGTSQGIMSSFRPGVAPPHLCPVPQQELRSVHLVEEHTRQKVEMGVSHQLPHIQMHLIVEFYYTI